MIIPAIETTATVTQNRQLVLDEPLPFPENSQVKLIVIAMIQKPQQSQEDWQKLVNELAGTWQDVPNAEEIRQNLVADLPREIL